MTMTIWRHSRRRTVGLAIFITILLISGCGSVQQLRSGPTITPPPPGGTLVDPPKPLDDFTLTDQHGDPLSLHDLAGKPALFYFGYTHCPDVCPLTLAQINQAVTLLADRAAEVNVVFVSVDGSRDTPERLDQYLGQFNDAFIGLSTDDESALQEATTTFGVFYELEDVAETQADYLVSHTASTFLIDSQGELVMIFAYQTPPQVITDGILQLLEAEAASPVES